MSSPRRSRGGSTPRTGAEPGDSGHDHVLCQKVIAELSQRLAAAEERARHVIARALHDDVGQLLVAAQLHVQILRDPAAPSEWSQAADAAHGLIGQAIRASRRLAFGQIDPARASRNLQEGIGVLAQRLEDETGISCRVQADPCIARLAPETAAAVLRVSEELLRNVGTHSEARSVAVEMAEAGGRLRITITDDGVGLELPPPPPSREGGIGLVIAAERAAEVGGDLTLTSKPAEGTEVIITVPLSGESRSER